MAIVASKSRKGFRLQEETYTPERKQVTIPREAYPALGFRFDMTLEEAKARAKQINQQKAIEAGKIIGASGRVKRKLKINELYLPKAEVALFENWLFKQYEDNEARKPVIEKYWNVTMDVISDLALDPKDFSNERSKILNHCKSKQWSHDYIKRIIRLMDQWGVFTARRRNSYYEPIPKLTSYQLEKIADSREDVTGRKSEAHPLRWEVLKASKDKFESEGLIELWNWMFIATWFGLRPKEVDNLHTSKYWRTSVDINSGVEVLEVFQTKIINADKDKKWKYIPIYFKEQKQAFEIIKSKAFRRPLNKTISARLGKGIETYSPRKGFTDLMLSLGFKLEDIALFMGHASIDMTWKHYKDKRRFNLPKAG